MSLHIRGPHGATLLRKDYGPVTAYNTKTDRTLGLCVYPYWHPSGRYIAYSTNTTNQLFHSAGKNRVEVFDTASDLQVYDVEKNELLLSPLLKQDSVYETYPVFSADGRSLYFCSSTGSETGSGTVESGLNSLRYNLCRIDFDPETGRFGERVDTSPSPSPVPPMTGGSSATRCRTTGSSASGTMRLTSGSSISPLGRAV